MPIPGLSLSGSRKRLKLSSSSSPPRSQDDGGARDVGGADASPAAPPPTSRAPDASVEAAAATLSAPTPSSPRQQPTYPCRVTALENLGNTCFLNVILQVLRYTPGFVGELSALASAVSAAARAPTGVPGGPASGDCGDPDLAPTCWRFVSSLHALYEEMSEREQQGLQHVPGGHDTLPAAPESLLSVLRELNPMFEGREQHDAHELLRCIQCYLQDAANLVNKACRTAADRSGPCSASEAALTLLLQKQHGEPCSAASDRCDRSSPSGAAACNSLPSAAPCCSPRAADELLLLQTTTTTPLLGGGRFFTDPRRPTLVSAPPRLHSLLPRPWRGAPERAAAHGQSTAVAAAASCAMQAHTVAACTPPALLPPWAAGAVAEDVSASSAASTGSVAAAASCSLPDVECSQQTAAATAYEERHAVVNVDAGNEAQRHSGTHNDGHEPAAGLNFSPKRARLSDGIVDINLPVAPSHASGSIQAGQSTRSMHQATLTSLFSKKQGAVLKQPGEPLAVADPALDAPQGDASDCMEHAEFDACLQHSDAAGLAKSADRLHSAPDCCAVAAVEPELLAADITDRLFQGRVTVRTRCLECESSSDRGDVFADVIVPIRRAAGTGAVKEASSGGCSERSSDDDGYDSDASSRFGSNTDGESCTGDSAVIAKAFCEREFLQGENKYYCERCMHHTEADISTRYASLPPILTVHLKRFAATHGAGYSVLQKLSDHVPTPLVLPCVVCRSGSDDERPCTDGSHRYFLYAVVVHVGSTLDLGHYVSYVRVAKGSHASDGPSLDGELGGGGSSCDEQLAWVTLDDDCATVSSIDALLAATGSRATPYLLFYCRGAARRCSAAESAVAGLCSGACHSLTAVRPELLLPRPEPNRDYD